MSFKSKINSIFSSKASRVWAVVVFIFVGVAIPVGVYFLSKGDFDIRNLASELGLGSSVSRELIDFNGDNKVSMSDYSLFVDAYVEARRDGREVEGKYDLDEDGEISMSDYSVFVETYLLPECEPDCSGKECGDDGCGGSCGTCLSGESCDSTGVCLAGTINTELPEPMVVYTADGYSGSEKCEKIAESIVLNDPFFSKYYTSADLIDVYFEYGGGYSQPCRSSRNGGRCVSCCKPVDGFRWQPNWISNCETRPVWTNMLMRHELTHTLARANWNYFNGNAKLYEFAADAMSNNGGGYKFRFQGGDLEYATTIKKRIIDNWEDYFTLKEGETMTDEEFETLFLQFLAGNLGNTVTAKETLNSKLEVGGNIASYMEHNLVTQFSFVGCHYPGVD